MGFSFLEFVTSVESDKSAAFIDLEQSPAEQQEDPLKEVASVAEHHEHLIVDSSKSNPLPSSDHTTMREWQLPI